jgi:hypothetical protein
MSERKTGVELIAIERDRQIEKEGYESRHDDQYTYCELVKAAMAYCGHSIDRVRVSPPTIWPWDWRLWKPSDPVRDLVKAGALIAAEIDRLQRLKPADERWQEKASRDNGF